MKNIVLAITESGDEDIFLLPPHIDLPPFSLIEVEGKEGKEKEKAKTIRKSIEVTEDVVSYVSSSSSPRRVLSIIFPIEWEKEEKK